MRFTRGRSRRLSALSRLLGLVLLAASGGQARAEWGSWESLGGVLAKYRASDCVSWGSNRIDCFAIGADKSLQHVWWNGSAWRGWESLGGTLGGWKPECVSWGANRIDCFAKGDPGNAMHHRWWDGTSWKGWESLGGAIAYSPSCVSWGPNRIDCFATGSNADLQHRWWTGTAWRGWESLGGQLASPPECVSRGPNLIDCFAIGGDDRLHHRAWNGSAWAPWRQIGGPVFGIHSYAPTCLTLAPNSINCFVRGSTRALYEAHWDGVSWDPLDNISGDFYERAQCLGTAGSTRIDCFAKGIDDVLYHNRRDSQNLAWQGWRQLGQGVSGAPACVSWGKDRIDCFAPASDDALHHCWWGSPDEEGECQCAVGREVAIPNSDTTSSSVGLVFTLPDGTRREAPLGGGEVKWTGGYGTVKASAYDDQGVSDIQLWVKETECVNGACTVEDRPINNRDRRFGGFACTSRSAWQAIIPSTTSTRTVSYEIFAIGVNFSGTMVRTPPIRVREAP